MDALTEAVREAYARCLLDPDEVWKRLSPDVVFHVAGDHPLSGDHVGLEAVRRLLSAVRDATHGRGGFSVTSAFTADSGELLLVEGTAFHGDEPFIRTIVHLVRLQDGLVVEFWDNPFDQRAEDRFWSARFPGQRARSTNGDRQTVRADRTIPAQLMRAFGRS
jgi:hypothetical protein